MSEEKEFRISQSMMKELFDYSKGKACGLIFVEKYFKGRFDLFPPSATQKLGTWFEYQCTKAVPKDGKIPLPDKTAKGELTAPYARMQTQVENFKKFISFYNIKILSTQDKWVAEGLEGTLDILALAQTDIKDSKGNILISSGTEFIMDIKSTGLLDDKWNDYGWHLDGLADKYKLILQPIHYKYLSILKYGREYDFLFLLFSTTNDYDFRSILFKITEQNISDHKKLIAENVSYLKKLLSKGTPEEPYKGFKAKPDLLRCMDCPLKIGCKYFEAVPKIQVFELPPSNA